MLYLVRRINIQKGSRPSFREYPPFLPWSEPSRAKLTCEVFAFAGIFNPLHLSSVGPGTCGIPVSRCHISVLFLSYIPSNNRLKTIPVILSFFFFAPS